jgi:anti-sigma regulatory factor (Ser/Thr protein kinase)
MSSDRTALRHNAFVYESQDEYVSRSATFLREGLQVGEGGIVVNTRAGIAAMREALGSDAAGVRFVDLASACTRPARTLAAYNQVYVEQLRKTPSVRAVAEVAFGPDPGEWDEWVGFEAVLNRSFAHLPSWVLCTYNANGLPDPVLDAVWRTHPEVVVGDRWTGSDRFEDPDELLRRITRQPEPVGELRWIPFGRDIEAFRERLARELDAEKVPRARALDMLVAGTEIAANALEHGGGVEAVRAGRARGRFVCEIIDRGNGFDDPAAGYLAPRKGVGTGLWIARQLTWRIEFFHSPQGFTARIWL